MSNDFKNRGVVNYGFYNRPLSPLDAQNPSSVLHVKTLDCLCFLKKTKVIIKRLVN